MPRRTLLAVAIAAFAIRIWPFLLPGRLMATPADYDTAVYFSAAALLFRGILPYRDFVFVHPPAALYLIGLTSFLDPAKAFAAARILIALIGAVNAYLTGRVVGGRGGVIAAILYATYQDAVLGERGPLLEPILNLVCLLGANLWLKRDKGGAWFGAAGAVKVLGGIWFLAALASMPTVWARHSFLAVRAVSPARQECLAHTLRRLALSALAVGLLLVVPVAIFAPRAYITQTLLFHSWRPPDGMGRNERLLAIFGGANLVVTLLAAIAVVSMFRRPVSREKRFFAVATILTIIGFLTAKSYWPQYNAYLAASMCALAGLGASVILRRARNDIVLAVIVLAQLFCVRGLVPASRERNFDVVSVGKAVRDTVPPNATLFAFDPLWSIAGGRLPRVVDTYGAALLENGQQKFPNVTEALHSSAAQAALRRELEKSDFVILGWRGNWQMSDGTRAWFESRFETLVPVPAWLSVWGQSHGHATTYGEGWHDPESMPNGQVFRWMKSRGVTTLPDRGARSHLGLDIYVPLDSMHGTPTLTIDFDGRTIDRIVVKKPDVVRAYDLDTPGAEQHTLTITTDQVVNPAKQHLSGDTRDLGLRLNSLEWRAAAGAGSTSSPR